MLSMFFSLLMGHAIADYALQSSTMGLNKHRKLDKSLPKAIKDSHKLIQKYVPWYYWLTGHSLVHGFMVTYITGNIVLGLLETISHWLIDFGKCEKWYGIHLDQFLHIFCKVVWIGLMALERRLMYGG